MNIAAIIGLAVGIVGALTGIGGLYVSWQTSRTSARKSAVDELAAVLENMREDYARIDAENTALRVRVQQLEGENERLEKRVELLEDKLRELGVNPDSIQ